MNRPLKLAIIYTDLSLGGIQRKIIDILNYINSSDYSNKIDTEVILRWKTDFSLIPNIEGDYKVFYPPRIFPFPRRRMPFSFNIIRRFLFNPPDVILTHVFASSMRSILFAKLLFGKKVKLIVSQDNIFSFENGKDYPKFFVTYIYNKADKVIVQTDISKKDLVENWNIVEDKVVVIPNWVRNIEEKSIKKDIDMIYVGRFEKQKNLLRLLKIFKSLANERPKTKLYLVGSGRQENILRDYVSRNRLEKNIFFVAPTNDVDSYLNRSKLFVLTSKFEGQPMALLEAMKLACVPISVNFPGVNEYLSHKKDSMVAKSNKEFIELTLNCLKNSKLRKKLSINAKETVDKKYSDKNIEDYLSLFL